MSPALKDPPTVSPALRVLTTPPPPPDCPSGTPQPGPPPPQGSCSGLNHSRQLTRPHGLPPGGVVGGCATAASRSCPPHPPTRVRGTVRPTSRRPHFTLLAEPRSRRPLRRPPRVAGGGAIAAALSSPLRPPSPAPPPPGPDTVGLFREAGRSSPLNRWISHVFGHFRPSRRKLPKWWRNLTALSEGWAEIAEPAAELAEGLKGRGTETRRRRLLAPEPAESSRSSPALLRLQRGEKRPQPARARTVTTRPLPVLRRK